MAWGDLASNEMVTFTNAATGGFTLNSGQSNVTSNECMTKTQALTKYNLSASAMSAYASNQLVPKSTWVNGVTYYVVASSYAASSGYSLSCSTTLTTGSLYTTNSSGIINVGDIIYTLSGGVYTPYYSVGLNYISYNEGSVRKVIFVEEEGSGEVLNKSDCGGTSFDLYNAEEYDCSSETTSIMAVVAFPSGTSVDFSKYYASTVTAGTIVYKPTSTATSGAGVILETTPYTTVALACSVL